MGLYLAEDLVFKPYSFNNATLTLIDLVSSESHTAQALNMIAAEMDEDKFEPFKVASGTSIQTFNPSKTGKLFFSLMEGSPTTDWIVAINEANGAISWSFSDENAVNLDCKSSLGYVVRAPRVERTNEVPVPEWVITNDYMTCKAGSFALYETA